MIEIQSIALQNHKLNFCFNRLVEVNTKKFLEVALYLQPRKGTLPRETNNISCVLCDTWKSSKAKLEFRSDAFSVVPIANKRVSQWHLHEAFPLFLHSVTYFTYIKT